MLKEIAISAAVSALLSGAGAGYLVYKYEDGQRAKDKLAYEVAQSQALQATIIMDRQSADASVASAIAYERAHAKIQTQIVTVTKEIHDHVTPQVDRDFPLPCGAIRLFNAAAEGREPAQVSYPTVEPDGQACPTKISDALTVMVFDLGVARTSSVQVEAWQDWWKTQQKIYDAPQ